MVGGYPDAPEQRIAYDLDDTIVWRLDDDQVTFEGILATTKVNDLNNEHNETQVYSGNVFDGLWMNWLFSKPYDLFGVWATGHGNSLVESIFVNHQYSLDQTVWSDGTWVSAGTVGFTTRDQQWDTWRTEVQTFSASAAKGFRAFTAGSGGLEFVDKIVRQVHLYGEPNAAATPDRVILLDKDTGLELNLYDWGYLPRGQVKTKTIQVKNNSGSGTANSVTLGFNSLNTHSPDGWHSFVVGTSSSTSLNVGNLGAGVTTSTDINVRVDTPSTAGLGPFANRITVDIAGGWS